MGEYGGTFILRHGETERTYSVDEAAVTFVRHPGGTALALTVGTHAESPGFGPMSAEFSAGPSLSIVLDGAVENRGDHPSWEYGPPHFRDATPDGAMSMLWLYDMHPIDRLAVELLGGDPPNRLLRLRGTAGGFSFEVHTNARFGGVTEFDPAPGGGRWWRGHFAAPVADWPAEEPLTETSWLHTDQFRRLVRACFPLPAPAPIPVTGPPEWRIATLARRIGLLPPHPTLPPRPAASFSPIRVSERQAQLLLAALVELYLADCRPNGSPDEFRDVARVIERFADGIPTAADRRATAPVIGRNCLTGVELLLNDYSPSSARSVLRFAHVGTDTLPHMLLQGLFPDRCRTGCELVREVLGNPFRPIDFAESWRTGAAVAVARGAYESGDFTVLPVLADALEDAGCSDERVLAHCREPDRHVRGCWVVDGVLAQLA